VDQRHLPFEAEGVAQGLEGEVPNRIGLEVSGIPEGVLVSVGYHVVGGLLKVAFEEVFSNFEPVLKDLKRPLVGPPLLEIVYLDGDVDLALH
jgi:hypothetical protein